MFINQKGLVQGDHDITELEHFFRSMLESASARVGDDISRVNIMFTYQVSDTLVTSPQHGAEGDSAFVRIQLRNVQIENGQITFENPAGGRVPITVFGSTADQPWATQSANAMEGFFNFMANAGIDANAGTPFDGVTVRRAWDNEGTQGNDGRFLNNPDNADQWAVRNSDGSQTDWRTAPEPSENVSAALSETWRSTVNAALDLFGGRIRS
ncbi:MAG: hypothetical protein J0L97_06795 [Alphaproteobacteria bacterium]|nr:hypothetical protein [Alphaproteobacteria bacterium]